jgi:ATP-dependent DNA helicase RecQ
LPFQKQIFPKISGFGAYKIERYGAPFLEKIQDYCNDHSLPTRIELKHPAKTKKAPVQKAPRERQLIQKRSVMKCTVRASSITEIAAQRGFSFMTIEAHLSYYVTSGELDVNEFVSEEKQELITAAANKYGRLGLKMLKDNLPDGISYMEIKMMVAALNRNDV